MLDLKIKYLKFDAQNPESLAYPHPRKGNIIYLY